MKHMNGQKTDAARILIADDQADVLKALRLLLKPKSYEIETASSVPEIVEAVKTRGIDLVLMDMNYVRGETSGEQGLGLVSTIKQVDDTIPVIVMTAWSSVELAVEAMRRGARDFVPKPWKNERLLSIIQNQLELKKALCKSRMLEQEVAVLKKETQHTFIAEAPSMRPVLETIARVGPSDANVLITGENGCGKGVIAQALHAVSPRKDQSMVSVNSASIPENIFESELFGHVAGAFTDAKSNRIGRFQLADKGTLFLDEIATIPVNLQPKLLRVLESSQFEPVGSSKTCRVDVRILSATNAVLDDEIKKETFRQDLLYRLNTITIEVPPLRKRKEDIPLLAMHFLKRYATKYRKAVHNFDEPSMQVLLAYPWPGNVRELAHSIERAVLMANEKLVRADSLGLCADVDCSPELEHMTLEELERWAINKALKRCGGDISKTATALALSRAALYRRLEKYQIS
jgi:DNA-binding NtrC family response regulator